MIHSFFALPETQIRMQEGPLGRYIEDYAVRLLEIGFSRGFIKWQIRTVADLSRWLQRRGLKAANLNVDRISAFVRNRCLRLEPREERSALRRFLNLLREKRVIRPAALIQQTHKPHQAEEGAFERFLLEERGLCSATAAMYLHFISKFLRNRFGRGPVRFAGLCAKDITGYLRHEAPIIGGHSTKNLATSLRSYLGYLQHRGFIATDLAACVPSVACWGKPVLPKFIPPDQVQKTLDSCDRSTPQGRRNHVILLLLARLGLRAGEVRNMQLEDIDWESGELVIRSKGKHIDRLPLPHEIGKALAAYLKRDRPICHSRNVFVRLKPPYNGYIASASLSVIVREALKKAGVVTPYPGAHLLRHSLATTMLRRGCSLPQIGQLLRHRQVDTTAIYAKVDVSALRRLARPWQGGVQ